VDQATHNKIVSFIWGIADDVLRDLFKRGKYPDVILPMCVIRRMDAVLEPTKQTVLDTKKVLDEARITSRRKSPFRSSVVACLPILPAKDAATWKKPLRAILP
jgi:type I restriction-modification system DNA methylase subunit